MIRHTTHCHGTSSSPPHTGRTLAAHVLSRFLGVTLAALLVLPIAETTRPVEAGKKTKTITRIVASNGQIAIPGAGTSGPANPYPTTIDVDEFETFEKATITDVNLTLRGLNHTLTENIDVMLVHNGRQALVMADPGNGVDVSDLTITLDDEAGAGLPNGAVLTSGTFRPGNQPGTDIFPAPAPVPNGNSALAAFIGDDPSGEWQLFINDDANSNSGSIAGGWELEITAKVKTDKDDKDVKKNKKDKKGKKKGKKNG